jgi:hypothetical protein
MQAIFGTTCTHRHLLSKYDPSRRQSHSVM